MAIALARFNSAILPSTTPRIIGASGKPKCRMTTPRIPNHASVQRSNSTLLSANTPMPQKPSITAGQHVHAHTGHKHEDPEHKGLQAEHHERRDEEGDEDGIGQDRLFADERRTGYDIVDEQCPPA